jgi:ERCC4-type nuclease
MNMEKYTQCIEDNAIDGATLAFMSDESLRVIGVSNALHRAKIIATIAKKKMNIQPIL